MSNDDYTPPTGERSYGEFGRCEATNRNGDRCGNPARGDHGKCYHHGGADGVGAPEGNANGLKHGLRADRGVLYDHLDDAKQDRVDRIEAALIDRYKEYHDREPDAADVRDLFEIAMGYVQRDFALEYMVEQAEESGNPLLEHVEMMKDGELIEFDKPNSLLDPLTDMRREDRMQRKDKGLEKDPETDKAESVSDLADAWRDALSE